MARAPLSAGQVGKSPMLTVKVAAEQLAAVDERARRLSVRRSDVVREALTALLESEAAAVKS